MLRLAVFLVASMLAAVVVGCGGSDNSSDSGTDAAGAVGSVSVDTSSLSKAEYIEQAEKLCLKASQKYLPALLEYMQSHENAKQSEEELIADAVDHAVVPKFQILIDELRELGAPEGDEKQIEAFLAAMLQATEGLERRNTLSLEDDIDREFSNAGELALDYGIVNCGN